MECINPILSRAISILPCPNPSYLILCYPILFYSILFYSILLYPILCYAMLCYAMLYYAIPLNPILFYSILFYSILCSTTLSCTILSDPYDILSYLIQSHSFDFVNSPPLIHITKQRPHPSIRCFFNDFKDCVVRCRCELYCTAGNGQGHQRLHKAFSLK